MKILTLAIFALLLPTVAAQSYKLYTPILGSGGSNVPATTTNTTFSATNGTTFAATRSLSAAIQAQLKLTGAGTSPVVLKFDESVDGLVWSTATRTLSVTPAGTATVAGNTALTLGAIGYLRLSQVENPNATAVTNLTLAYSEKIK